VSGSPSHVVLLHGQPGTGSDWDRVIERLPAGVSYQAPDRPGYRSSPHPATDLVANARLLLAELDSTGVGRTVLVGHSYGGGVALAMAALAPERFCGLVLIASVGPGCLGALDRLLAAPVAGPVCAVTALSVMPWLARTGLAGVRRRPGRRQHSHDRSYDRSDDRSHDRLGWESWAGVGHEHGAVWRTFLAEQRELVHHPDALDTAIRAVRSPSLIIADPADRTVPVNTAFALHEQLPGSRIQLVGHGGHNLPRTSPDVVAASIAGFLGVLGSSGAGVSVDSDASPVDDSDRDRQPG
jgi:3-oxoadipate enol-lactonase